MENDTTRRRFFWQAGAAAFAAPLAVAATDAASDGADASAALRDRVARLEDEHAIRALNRAYVRHVNDRADGEIAALFADPREATEHGVRRVLADRGDEGDVIEVAADRMTAVARLHRAVQIEVPIEPACPLVAMAREQGGGVVKRSENGVFENVYVKQGRVWKIRRSAYRPA